ncbi:MAG: hypothetical protein BWY15_01986 [Firmicutes bacterium ADurb.Bin193]|nr:MAG: hypothetical protein BWY15_01986 [Firmicutes bacterium ADurb.Bin193]
MTSEERKNKLVEIQQGEPSMTGITLTYHGERKSFEAYRIPLAFLTYNPYNGRIGSEVKSYERQHHQLNPDNEADVKIIERFLWESKENANKRTMESLLFDHQQRFGIVTADGKIIDGNRRASLLNRIWNDETIPPNQKQHCQYFEAIILPIDADRKEILRLETTYQMGEDAKVDYGPIEKYLKAGDLAEEGFSNKEIASFMGIENREVEMYLNVLQLMNDYLDTYGYTGIYTQLDTREDSFIKLETALRVYKAGGVSKMWAYDIEADVSDLKSIAFDYIRLGLDQLEFRDIIRKPNKNNTESSFFANEEIWRAFSEGHFETIDTVTEKPVEDIIRENPTGDLKRLLRSRDNDWKKSIGEKLSANFMHFKDKLNNKQQAAEPIKLLQKAWEALSAVDTTQPSFKCDPGIKEYLDNIQDVITEYNGILE